MLGIRRIFALLAAQLFTANVTPAPITALTIAAAIGQRMKIRYWIPLTVGAAGGLRAQVTGPAGMVTFRETLRLNNTVAPAAVIAAYVASTNFTNALANAGTHWLEIEVDVEIGTTAGNIELLMAQNTSDATALTILAGATAEVTVY